VRKNVEHNGVQLKLQIWHTAGQESFKSLAPMYYRSAAAVFILFDVTRISIFDNTKYWVNQIALNGSSEVKIVVVANKIDIQNVRKVAREDAENYAKQIGANYMEVSAVSGQGVDEMFNRLLEMKLHEKGDGEVMVGKGMIKDNIKVGKCC
jgi:small GTP-binding protein